eukprot:6182933-Pleurochrysis_carterae.AAC.1
MSSQLQLMHSTLSSPATKDALLKSRNSATPSGISFLPRARLRCQPAPVSGRHLRCTGSGACASCAQQRSAQPGMRTAAHRAPRAARRLRHVIVAGDGHNKLD